MDKLMSFMLTLIVVMSVLAGFSCLASINDGRISAAISSIVAPSSAVARQVAND